QLGTTMTPNANSIPATNAAVGIRTPKVECCRAADAPWQAPNGAIGIVLTVDEHNGNDPAPRPGRLRRSPAPDHARARPWYRDGPKDPGTRRGGRKSPGAHQGHRA